MDLSANGIELRFSDFVPPDVLKSQKQLTAEQQPEGPPTHFALDEVEALVRRFFMHSQGHGDMCRFTKGRMLCSVVAFAEVIYTVAVSSIEMISVNVDE